MNWIHNLENFSADKNTEKLLSGEMGNHNTAKGKAEIEIETSNAQITIE